MRSRTRGNWARKRATASGTTSAAPTLPTPNATVPAPGPPACAASSSALRSSECAARAGEEGASRRGRHDAARVALQQLHVQLGLQPADALGDGGLRHAEPARGGADAAAFDHGDEVADLAESHGDSSLAIRVKAQTSYLARAPRALLPAMRCVLLFLLLAGAAQAADYPARPIRLLVPGAAGSPPDTLARIVAEPLAALGQPVLVENRPGGFGTLALGAVAKAPPDGHTLGITGLSQIVAPSLHAALPYDVLRDFAPVTQLAWTATLLVVPAPSPLRTLADFVELAKARPGSLTCASAGNGTPSHLACELFRHRAGIELRHVPFKGIPAGL